MDFGHALKWLKEGSKLTRRAWAATGAPGQFIYYVRGSMFKVNRAPLNVLFDEGTTIEYHAHIDMHTAQGACLPWTASTLDLLAEDWQITE